MTSPPVGPFALHMCIRDIIFRSLSAFFRGFHVTEMLVNFPSIPSLIEKDYVFGMTSKQEKTFTLLDSITSKLRRKCPTLSFAIK